MDCRVKRGNDEDGDRVLDNHMGQCLGPSYGIEDRLTSRRPACEAAALAHAVPFRLSERGRK
jgi:hypothetical protein